MNKIYHWLVILCLLVSAGISQAQLDTDQPDGNNKPDAEQASQQQVPEKIEQDDNEQDSAKPPVPSRRSDSFVPSEEISEDLSVSFPVDI